MRRTSLLRCTNAAAFIAFGASFFVVASACGQEPSATTPDATAAPAEGHAEPSDAERISTLQNLLKGDKDRLASLEKELKELDKDFEKTKAEFNRLDEAFPAERKTAIDAQASRAELSDSDRAWADARDNFNVTIARRKAVDQQIATLKEKIALETQALDRLTSSAAETPDTAPAPAKGPAVMDPAPVDETPGKQSPAGVFGMSALLLPGQPKSENAQTGATAADTAGTPAAADELNEARPVVDSDLLAARKELAVSEAALETADTQVDRLNQAEDLFERNLTDAEALLDADRQELKIADQQLRSITDRLAQTPANAADDRARLTEEQTAARTRLTTAQRNVTEHAAQVDELQTQIEQLRTLKENALKKVEEASSVVDTARNWVWYYESPLAPHRIWEWITKRGPNVLVILLMMVLAWWLTRIIGKRVIAEIALRSRRGNAAEREMRADTLRRVFQSTASVAIVAIGALALLNQTGFDVTVLLGGAAVIGAAIAFGSQNLIKDYFSGFMILVENQYSVGNVIGIGDTTGTVEDVTLRMTVLRDLEGVVHFIPHSQVNTVSNLTHGWSRVVFDVGIGYGENVDRVMEVLMDLARTLRDDETFGPMMLGEPEMLGVDQFADSAIVIRFLVKTRPLKQWNVKRELLRRIKNEFDKLDIEIPFPHRTVYHRDLV